MKSYRRTLSSQSVMLYSGLAAGSIALICLMIFLFLPEVFLDGFLKSRITRAFEQAYPAYSIRVAGLHYGIWENRLECDSLTIMRNDFAVAFSVSMASVSGIDRMQLLKGNGGDPTVLERTHAEAKNIVLAFKQQQYELRCASARLSVPDSTIEVRRLEFLPDKDDELLFAESKFMKTRYRLAIEQCRIEGLACLELLQQKSYRARTA